MYRRYIVVGLVFLLLIGAYFVFFDKDKSDKEYSKYYNMLVEIESYADSLDGVSLSIDEIEEEGVYNYIVTFDNVIENKKDVKILVLDSLCNKKEMLYFPSFGIVDNKGYTIIPSSGDRGEKEIKGVNLTFSMKSKMEYMLVLFLSDGEEQIARVKVENYLG